MNQAADSFHLISLIVRCGASVTDAPPLLLQAIKRHFEQVRGAVTPASLRQLIGAGLMNLEKIGTKTAASGETLYNVDAILPLLKYVTCDLACDDGSNMNGPPAKELRDLPLLPLAASSQDSSDASLITMNYFSEYTGGQAHPTQSIPVLDIHSAPNGDLQPSPGTKFLPRSRYEGPGGAVRSSEFATPVVPYPLARLLFPFKSALSLHGQPGHRRHGATSFCWTTPRSV